jgi:hypothetical protein
VFEAAPAVLLPFEASYVPGTFAAMNIYDMTTGTPVFLKQVPMTHVFNGTYCGFYTFIADKTYLMNISVYTDDTYTTPDLSDYPPASETYSTFKKR